MAVVDAVGRLVRFTLIPGNAAEVRELPTLLDGVQTDELIADRAYDSDAARNMLAARRIIATIPPKVNRRVKPWHDEEVYKLRHFVENRFVVLKDFRGVATRYCKLGTMYGGMVHAAALFCCSREATTGRQPGGSPHRNRRLAL